jgi:hypothetical protein
MNRLVRIVVILAIVFFVSKHVVRMIKKRSGNDSCVRGAERASEKWGNGLRQFVNPPYDLNA